MRLGNSRSKTIVLSLCLLIALWLLARHIAGVHPAPPEELTFFLSADTRGCLETRGCSSGQSGGLPVRATLIKRDTARCRLLIDSGGVTCGSRKYDQIKFHYLLKGMEVMGYDAVNLGATEVMLDKGDLLALVRRHPRLHFISCNVLDARSRRPAVEPYAILRVAGFRVGIVGVVEDGLEVLGKELTIAPPLEALSQWVPEAARRCDYLVVAGYVGRETMKAIAGRFFEVDAILGGDVTESDVAPEQINRATVFSVTGKGGLLGRILLRREGEKNLKVASGQVLRVADSMPGDARLRKVVDEFKEELRRRRIELAERDDPLDPIAPTGQSSVTDRYVGAGACKDCHESAYAAWRNSSHFRSFAILKPRRNQFDPECLTCHTTGYRESDGYTGEEKTSPLAMVQCESCHGRGWRHVQAMRHGEKPTSSTFRSITPNTCLRCHDKESRADFEFSRSWTTIAHKQDAKPRK